MRDVIVRQVFIALVLALGATLAYAQGVLRVATVNYPLAYFAERIGSAAVTVRFPAPREVDPAFWNPDAASVLAYQMADLILLNGAGYARWVGRASLPRRKLVDTSRAFRERLLKIEDAATHAHGPSGAHAHTGTAFVTWLDPMQAIEQARAIKDAFTRARPALAKQFDENFEQLGAELKTLDAALGAAFKPLASQPLVASHPVYQYLARRYALDLRSVQWEPDSEPSASQWRDFGKLLETHRARFMLWEAAPQTATEKRLAAMGVRSIVFAPAPSVPVTGDFMRVMQDNVAALRAAAQSAR